MSSKKARPGAVRKKSKGKAVGSGGQGRQALEGRGPTPKAEDRPYHPKAKARASRERYEAARARHQGGSTASSGRSRSGGRDRSNDSELVTGRNSIVEALRAKIPATALYVAAGIESDDRVRESLRLATNRSIPVLEVMRAELDRMTDRDTVHQGLVLKVAALETQHPMELLEHSFDAGAPPLFVALDGITDPRNLGAIIRSVGAFGGHGVIVPQRRSAGLNAAAWKTSAGAAARVPVAVATNLTQTIKEFKKQGVFVVGLDGGGEVSLPGLELADRPLLLVIGSEGSGLSRLVTTQCDVIVSIPISSATESLNAGIAASVALYEVSKLRGEFTAP